MRDFFIAAAVAGIGMVFGLNGVRSEDVPKTRISGPYAHENLSVYFVHGASAPGAVPLTSSEALNNATLPFGLSLAGKGLAALAGNGRVATHVGDVLRRVGLAPDRVLADFGPRFIDRLLGPLDSFVVQLGLRIGRSEDAHEDDLVTVGRE